MDDAMTVTIDKAGRLVVPKAIREEAGVTPGMHLRIRVRDGRIEIDPPYARVRTVRRHGLLIAEAIDPIPTLSHKEVRRLIRGLRERRIR